MLAHLNSPHKLRCFEVLGKCRSSRWRVFIRFYTKHRQYSVRNVSFCELKSNKKNEFTKFKTITFDQSLQSSEELTWFRLCKQYVIHQPLLYTSKTCNLTPIKCKKTHVVSAKVLMATSTQNQSWSICIDLVTFPWSPILWQENFTSELANLILHTIIIAGVDHISNYIAKSITKSSSD